MAASSDPTTHTFARPRAREWIVIVTIATALVVYLPIVIRRTVVMGFGDVQVFFRAAWAIWTGFPLYEVVDSHGWSYHYPPSFALVLAPFANPMPGYPQPAWALPYPAAVAVWYLICTAAVIASVHIWASALERTSGVTAGESYWRPWWMLRLGPLLALIPFVGDGLGRGQPTGILILLIVGFLVLYAEGRRHGAAVLLAIAVTIKLFPAAFAIIPLLRRDVRTLAFLALWCLILLFGLPAALLGPDVTIELYRTVWNERLAGILTGQVAPRIARELSPWSYDMSSIGAMLGRVAAGTLPAFDTPLPGWVKLAQQGANAILVGLLVVLGHGRYWSLRMPQPDRPYPILVAGAILLAALPAMLSVSQANYWSQAMPLFAILTVEAWRRTGRAIVSRALFAWSAAAWLGMIATEVTIWQPLRLLGLTIPVMLVLVGAGFMVLARSSQDAIFARSGRTT